MLPRLSTAACLLLLLSAAQGAASDGRAAEIGEVRQVLVYAYGTPPGAARGPLYARDAVVQDELVETVAGGGLELRFLDDTRLVLGELSQVRLDRYVYDPDPSAQTMTINLLKGLFRFSSGAMAKEGVEIRTPTVQIGLRGTTLGVAVEDDGATDVEVFEGAISITTISGDSADVATGEVASVDAGGNISVGSAGFGAPVGAPAGAGGAGDSAASGGEGSSGGGHGGGQD